MTEAEKNTALQGKVDLGIKVEANLNPVINATPGAVATLMRLLFKDKYSAAARLTLLSEAQNKVDVQRIIEGKAILDPESGALVAAPIDTASDGKDLREFIKNTLQEEEIANLISCTLHAASNVEGDGPHQTTASPEFVNRWRNEAKFISEDTAQAMWGRILSEEVNSPNSISIRTLDVIKSLTRAEAESFREACKLVCFGQFLLDLRQDKAASHGATYALLADAGLIAPIGPMLTTTPWAETTIHFEGNPIKAYFLQVGKLFIYLESDKIAEAPTFCFLPLSNAGKEMYRIISKEIEHDAAQISTAFTTTKTDIRGDLKYTIYTNLEKQEIDFNLIQPVFAEAPTTAAPQSNSPQAPPMQ